MPGINKVILIGNLGKDPEIRNLKKNESVAVASVATSSAWKDKNGEKQEKTEWHRVVFFGRLAEIAGEYLRKGSQVYIEGRLQTNKWEDKEGNDRYTTEIVANEMQMLGKKSDNVSTNEDYKPYGIEKKNAPPPPDDDGFDDDIPF